MKKIILNVRIYYGLIITITTVENTVVENWSKFLM